MLNRWMQRGITGLVLSLALALIAVQCGKKTEETAADRSMVVVFVTGDVRVIHTDTKAEEPLKVGNIVKANDQIKTSRGSVDLQTRTGSAVRIREYSTLTVASLAGASGGETRLSMKQGGILANVKKASASEEFNVVTPTAVAGVRGTKFSVQVAEDGGPRVKVVEGKVAMAPRVAALDNYTKEEIAADPTLTKLAEIEKAEVILEDKTEGTLDPVLEAQVVEVNQAIETAQKENKKVEEVVETKKVEELVTTVEENKAPVQKEEVEITLQETVEHESLVIVDPTLLEKVNASTVKEDSNNQVADAIQMDRKAKEERILEIVKKEAEKQVFKTDEEIKEHYQTLETIILQNGEIISGAIIAQTGDVMMIHTTEKVRRVNKKDIKEQRFSF